MAQPIKGQRPARNPVPVWWFVDTTGVVGVSATLAESADVLAAQAGGLISASATLSEGAETLAAQAGPVVASSASLSESADTLAGQVSPQVTSSAALAEGADALAAAVNVAATGLQVSAALTEDADVLQAQLGGTVAGGYDDSPKKRRFIQKVGDRLIITSDASDALAAAAQDERQAPVSEAAKPRDNAPPEVTQTIALAEIRSVAAQYQQQARVLQLFRQRDWAEMVALYESLRAQQDEDDIELMLLSL